MLVSFTFKHGVCLDNFYFEATVNFWTTQFIHSLGEKKIRFKG